MTNYVIVPLAATVISIIFAYSVFRQYLRGRKTHQLLWTISLALFSFSVFFEAYSELYGWNVLMYKIYYIFAASLVLIMGAGTLYLLSSWNVLNRYIPHLFVTYGIIIIVIMSYTAYSAPVYTEKFIPGITVAGLAMSQDVRIFSPLLTIPGSIALIGGALYSYFKTKQRFNVYIALGALIVAVSGGIARTGITDFFYIGEMIGITLMYFGFIESNYLIKLNKIKI